MSHYGAKSQGLTQATKVLVDFVNLMVAGKANTENNINIYKCTSSMSHQNVTLHLYFSLHSKIKFSLSEAKSCLFTEKKSVCEWQTKKIMLIQ